MSGTCSNPPNYDTAKRAIFLDKVIMSTNPAYAAASTVKMEDNSQYHSMATDPGGEGRVELTIMSISLIIKM